MDNEQEQYCRFCGELLFYPDEEEQGHCMKCDVELFYSIMTIGDWYD